MAISSQQVESDKTGQVSEITRRRREVKDILLGDDPPKVLSLSIVIIAAVLGTFVAASQSIEYEETVPITITLTSDTASATVYGVGYLQQHDVAKVQTGQIVRLDNLQHQVTEHSQMEISVSDISLVNQNTLYKIRVELSSDFVSNSGLQSAPGQEEQAQAKIVTRKQKLFDRVFDMLQALFGQ